MAASVYSRTCQRAAELVGGRPKLARRLRVPQAEIERWIADKAVPPMGIFLKVVDLLIEESAPPPGSDSDTGEPPAPRDCASGSAGATYEQD